MIIQKMPRRLLIYETIGVVAMIAFFWLDEFFGWPRMLFGRRCHLTGTGAALKPLWFCWRGFPCLP